MSKRQSKIEDIESIADRAQRGQDVSNHFTGRFTAKQRVNVDFPLGLLRLIDQECKEIGITRQAWIKMACNDKIRSVQSNRATIKVS